MLRTENVLAGLDARRQAQVHVGALLRGLLESLDLIEHLLAALRPFDGLLPVETLELRDDFFLMTDLCLLVHPRLQL